MKRTLALLASALLAAPPARAQTVPADAFAGLRLDTDLPARVASGEPVVLAGAVLDDEVSQLVFSFQAIAGDRQSIDFYIEHLPGRRFQRHVTFAAADADSFDLAVFAGRRDESLAFRGAFRPFVVTRGNAAVDLPARFFDGVVLDAPLPTRVAVGAALPVAGQVVDDRVLRLRLDVTRADGQVRSVPLALDGRRFRTPLRLAAQEAGQVDVELVVELDDGTFRGRGAYRFVGLDSGVPAAAPTVLSAAFLPGGDGDIAIANRGDADLHLLAVTATGPFAVVSTPGPIAPSAAGAITLRYDGSGGDEGELVVDTDDPLQPRLRIDLAGVADGQRAVDLAWTRADLGGTLTATAPGHARFAVALFCAPTDPDPSARYPIAVGAAPASARPVAAAARSAPLAARQRGEGLRAQRAARLAANVRRLGLPALRPARALAAVGDRRTFVFDAFPPVARQEIAGRVVAVSARAVAWVHEGTSADGGPLAAERIAGHLRQFDADYDLVVSTFGAPSDVDGDGRVTFLYTPLVDDVGLAGFQDPGSVLPEAVGGNGNLVDLLFLSPSEAEPAYRSLLVHECQHLISFNQHVLVRGGREEATWLDEGLSHLSEDLVGGFVSGGNADNLQTFLADPSAAGLLAADDVTSAERGAAYLFARSLVDRFGLPVLLRLVQSGLADVDNLEQATGVRFEELLAGWSVRLFASGTGLAGHSRFDFAFAGLGGAGHRAFPLPATLRYGAGTGPVHGILRPRGAAFVEVDGADAAIAADADAGLAGIVLPLPEGFAPRVEIPADYFPGLHFDPPLPGTITSGEPVPLRGAVTEAGVSQVVVQFASADDRVRLPFQLSLDGQGRFERTVVFDHAEAGDLALAVFATGTDGASRHAGSFWPVRVAAGTGAILLPAGYFDGVTFAAPLPTRFAPGVSVAVSGTVRDAAVDEVAIDFSDPSGGDGISLRLPVRDGRFEGELSLPPSAAGTRSLRLFTGVGGDYTFRGSHDHVTVGVAAVTAVTDEGALPAVFSLDLAWPNPFNGQIALGLVLPRAAAVEVEVFDIAGQHVATLWRGALPAGRRHLAWDGRDGAGRPAASGAYVVRALAQGEGGRWRKVLLLR